MLFRGPDTPLLTAKLTTRRSLCSEPPTRPSMPSRILVGLNRRDPNWHDVFALDLRAGKLDLVFQNTGYSLVMADDQLRLRLVAKAQPDGSFDYFRVDQGRVEARVLEHVPLADSRSTEPLGFAADGRTLYWVDSRGRDTAALLAHGTVTNGERLLGEHGEADVETALFNPVTGVAEGFNVHHLRTDWLPWNGGWKAISPSSVRSCPAMSLS